MVAPSEFVTYTLSYTNAADSASGVQISDVLAPHFIVTATDLGGGSLVGNTVFWDLGTVAPGASGVVSFQAQVGPPSRPRRFT